MHFAFDTHYPEAAIPAYTEPSHTFLRTHRPQSTWQPRRRRRGKKNLQLNAAVGDCLLRYTTLSLTEEAAVRLGPQQSLFRGRISRLGIGMMGSSCITPKRMLQKLLVRRCAILPSHNNSLLNMVKDMDVDISNDEGKLFHLNRGYCYWVRMCHD